MSLYLYVTMSHVLLVSKCLFCSFTTQRIHQRSRFLQCVLKFAKNVVCVFMFLASDNRIESLIQKADEVLSSLSQSSAPADSGETG